MKNKSNNFAYIDGANLYRGVESLGWELDYRGFRRTGAKIAYINDQRSHLELIQKEKTPDGDGTP